MVTPADLSRSTLRLPTQGNEALEAWKMRAMAKEGFDLEKYIMSTKTTMDGLKVRDKFAKDLLTEKIEKEGYVPQLFNYSSGQVARVDINNPKTRNAILGWVQKALADPNGRTADMVIQLVASQDVVKLATGIKNVEKLKSEGYLAVREEQAKLTIKKIKE